MGERAKETEPMSRTPIADHALLSDRHSVALVSRDGSVDWLCFPRFDGPSVFARLLDEDAGHWAIRPSVPYQVSRRYVDQTMVLETTFRTASGAVTPSASGTAGTGHGRNAGTGTGPEPQGTSSSTAHGADETGSRSAPGSCDVEYRLDNQWPDGFQATVTVTTGRPLTDWTVGWTFRDGQRVGQMWDAKVAQDGSRVTAGAADYNKSVAAGATLSFGFLASWDGRNTAPRDFTLNGAPCSVG